MRRALGLLLAVVVMSGCAARSAERSAGAPPSVASSATPSAAASPGVPASPPSKGAPAPADSVISLPPGLPKTTAVGPPTDDFTVLTATGKVRLRPGCVELVTANHVWVLVGPSVTGLTDGQQVKVTGLPDPSFETQCMGSPLKVSAVAPA